VIASKEDEDVWDVLLGKAKKFLLYTTSIQVFLEEQEGGNTVPTLKQVHLPNV